MLTRAGTLQPSSVHRLSTVGASPSPGGAGRDGCSGRGPSASHAQPLTLPRPSLQGPVPGAFYIEVVANRVAFYLLKCTFKFKITFFNKRLREDKRKVASNFLMDCKGYLKKITLVKANAVQVFMFFEGLFQLCSRCISIFKGHGCFCVPDVLCISTLRVERSLHPADILPLDSCEKASPWACWLLVDEPCG